MSRLTTAALNIKSSALMKDCYRLSWIIVMMIMILFMYDDFDVDMVNIYIYI
jgi:hypothetical protein